MAESFVWGKIGQQDISFGFGTDSATLPNGSSVSLDRLNLSYLYPGYAVTYSATPAFDMVNGVVQTITLTGNVTSSTIVATGYTLVSGSRLVLRIIQDVTGGRSFVWPTSVTGAASYMVSKVASQTTIAELQYNGATWDLLWMPINLAAAAAGVARLRSIGGTALVAGDFALSGGWGTTATVSTVTGTDQRCQFTVTSAGTGQAANPTITLTFKDGSWGTTPFAIVVRNGGNAYTFQLTWLVTTTQLIVTFRGLPIAGETFTFTAMVMG